VSENPSVFYFQRKNNTIIRNLTITGSAGSNFYKRVGALTFAGFGDHLLLENLYIKNNRWGGISMMHKDSILRNLVVENNGWKGIGISGENKEIMNIDLQSVETSKNAFLNDFFLFSTLSWDQGGIKIAGDMSGIYGFLQTSILDGGPGIWWDLWARDVAFDSSAAVYSKSYGVFSECSHGPAVLTNGVFAHNSRPGLFIKEQQNGNYQYNLFYENEQTQIGLGLGAPRLTSKLAVISNNQIFTKSPKYLIENSYFNNSAFDTWLADYTGDSNQYSNKAKNRAFHVRDSSSGRQSGDLVAYQNTFTQYLSTNQEQNSIWIDQEDVPEFGEFMVLGQTWSQTNLNTLGCLCLNLFTPYVNGENYDLENLYWVSKSYVKQDLYVVKMVFVAPEDGLYRFYPRHTGELELLMSSNDSHKYKATVYHAMRTELSPSELTDQDIAYSERNLVKGESIYMEVRFLKKNASDRFELWFQEKDEPQLKRLGAKHLRPYRPQVAITTQSESKYLSNLNNYNEVSLSVSEPFSNAHIHYTLDGSEPTLASPLYTAPFSVNTTSTLKAKAFFQGELPSVTVEKELVFVEQSNIFTTTNSTLEVPAYDFLSLTSGTQAGQNRIWREETNSASLFSEEKILHGEANGFFYYPDLFDWDYRLLQQARYLVDLPQGEYYFWIRALDTTFSARFFYLLVDDLFLNHSLPYSMDTNQASIWQNLYRMDKTSSFSTTQKWNFQFNNFASQFPVENAPMKIKLDYSGIHEITFLTPSALFKIDAFLLTTDENYIP
jgi:hypothetical protein